MVVEHDIARIAHVFAVFLANTAATLLEGSNLQMNMLLGKRISYFWAGANNFFSGRCSHILHNASQKCELVACTTM